MRGEIRDGHLVWVDNGMAYDVPDDDIRVLVYYSPEETGGPAELYLHTCYREDFKVYGEAATLFADYHLAKAREEERNAIHGIALRRVD
jgi:hypothetical protein